MRSVLFLLLSYSLIVPGSLFAQIPQLISYQGRVVVNGTNFTGNGQFNFALIDPGPPSVISHWSNDGTSVAGSQPSAAVQLQVTRGLFSVLLGDTNLTNMTELPQNVFTNGNLNMRLWFNGGSGFQLLEPDQRISSVAYAMMAGSMPDDSITSDMLQDGAVETEHLSHSYQSGRVTVEWDRWFVPQASVTVTFDTPFAVEPIVTVNAQVMEGELLADHATVVAVTKSNFTAHVTTPFAVRSDSDAVELDAAPSTDRNVSMADVFASPAISYYDDTWPGQEGIRFVRAFDTDWTGIYADNASEYDLTWKDDPTMVVSSVLASTYVSLAMVSSNPAICYCDISEPNHRLRYVRATNAWSDIYAGNNTVTNWADPVTVTTGSGHAFMNAKPTMLVVNGKPAICYYDEPPGGPGDGIKFARAFDADGAAWLGPNTVVGATLSDPCVSFAVVNGNPAVCYYDDSVPGQEGIKFVRATNADGTSWDGPVGISSGVLINASCSLAEIGGVPAISYWETDPWEPEIKYVQASNANGTTWGQPTTVDEESDVRQTALLDLAGRPAIAWRAFDGWEDDIECARARDIDGTSWNYSHIDESYGSPPYGLSFAAINGDPVIAYYDGWGPEIDVDMSPNREAYLNWVAVEP